MVGRACDCLSYLLRLQIKIPKATPHLQRCAHVRGRLEGATCALILVRFYFYRPSEFKICSSRF